MLVNRIADERRAAGDLVAEPLRLARGREPLAAVATALLPLLGPGEQLATRLADALDRVRELGLLGARVSVGAPTEDRYASLAELLAGLVEHAAASERLLVIRVDEVQNLSGDPLSQLLTLLGDVLERRLEATDVTGARVEHYAPVVVLLSGLPQFPERAAEAGATFSRRFATTYLEPFTDEEVRAALTFAFQDGFEVLGEDGPVPIGLETAAREELVERCLGDPFLFQLAGASAWDAGTGRVITLDEVRSGWARVRREVGGHVRARLTGLTELQRQVLTAAAQLAEQGPDGTSIARQIGRRSSSEIGSTLQGLVAKHLLHLEPAGYRMVSRALARELTDH